MPNVIGANKQELDSTYSFGAEGRNEGLILDSWGPTERNPEYAQAMEVLLSRLKDCGVPYVKVWAVTSRLKEAFPTADQRAIRIGGSDRITLSGQDPKEARLAIGEAVANLKEDPGTKGGNRYKKVLLYHPLVSKVLWQEIASGTQDAGAFADVLNTPTSDRDALDEKVSVLLSAEEDLPEPKGNKQPTRSKKEIEQIERVPQVKAWVLRQAKGSCEVCEAKAPFTKEDGTPYLEVHHLRPLAAGGSDTVANAVAVCPNCHMALHYSVTRDQLRKSVLAKVQRLQDEGGPD